MSSNSGSFDRMSRKQYETSKWPLILGGIFFFIIGCVSLMRNHDVSRAASPFAVGLARCYTASSKFASYGHLGAFPTRTLPCVVGRRRVLDDPIVQGEHRWIFMIESRMTALRSLCLQSPAFS